MNDSDKKIPVRYVLAALQEEITTIGQIYEDKPVERNHRTQEVFQIMRIVEMLAEDEE